MAKQRIPLFQNPRNFATVEDGATKGAQLGTDLRGPDGQLLRPEQIINPATSTGSQNQRTVWKQILEIPANIRKIAALVGKGFAVRQNDGEWALRTLQPGDAIEIQNGDGEAGNPVIGLEDLPDSGVGAALVKTTRDAKGRTSGTSSATTTDLAEGTNLYYTDARADARISAQKGQPNGLTPLGPDSKIPNQYLPPLAITSTFVVNSQAAQLALDAQEGDVAVRTDLNKNYIKNAGTTGTMADWTELLTPAAPVQSVNGKTGNVVLNAADVGAAPASAAFPEAPTDGWPYARGSSAWQPLAGPNSPYVLLTLPALTDQTGRVLTDQQGRVMFANVPQIPFAWLVGVQAAVKQIYPLSALPAVTPYPREIYVSGTSGVSGIIPAYSDGTNWIRFSDNTPVN